MLKIVHDLHGGEKPKVLMKLHPDTKDMKFAYRHLSRRIVHLFVKFCLTLVWKEY